MRFERLLRLATVTNAFASNASMDTVAHTILRLYAHQVRTGER
jgi:hypothetical protein